MSAPDVERLRDVLTEARFRMGCACFPEDGEWCHKCKSARSDIDEALAALSSRPDSIPPQDEAIDMLYRIRDIVGGIGAPDTIGKLDEQVRWMKEALNLHRSTIADLNAKLAALSSRPDPLPASADIAGRLAIATRDLIDAVEKACEWDAETRVGNAIAVVESLLAAYRANPSGDSLSALRARIAELEKQTERDGMTIRKLQTCKQIAEKQVAEADRSADIAGRLAEALDRLRQAVEKHFGMKSDTRFRTAMMLAEESIAAYRANPSRWIPVGEMDKSEMQLILVTQDEAVRLRLWNPFQKAWEYPDFPGKIVGPWETCGEPTHFQRLGDLPPPPQDEHSGRIYTAPEEIEAAQRQMREGKV